ncbi:MAG: ATP-binding protein [Oscillospiraceae bacterium]|jgi:predicted AAA+ superfamily ATPase|nr:ATP-binding protein [Oscillospiraceae bacterium]
MYTLTSALKRLNRWWRSGAVDRDFIYSTVRSEFHAVARQLKKRRILAVVGPRRVGKSTLLFQTIDHLLKAGTKPAHVLFFSGDEPALFTEANTIGDILTAYETDILQQNLEDLTETVYVVIDEIHFISNWQQWLKSYYDRKYRIKFIVSGSSSTHLFHGARESLLGRMDTVNILPLSFDQFAVFHDVYRGGGGVLGLRALLPGFSFFDDPLGYAQALMARSSEVEACRILAGRVFNEYLLVGGYPEFFASDSILLWQKQLTEDIITRGLFRDIVGIYTVKNPELLEKLLYFVAANSGQPHAYATLAQTLGIDFQTVSNYLSYLKSAFMVGILDNYSTNIGKVVRKNKKLYITDCGLRNALLRAPMLEDGALGHIAEGCAVTAALAYAQENLYAVNYWSASGGHKEVDIVLDKKISALPIEVKFRGKVSDEDLSGIRAFCKTFGAGAGAVITKDTLDAHDGTALVPLWMVR